MCIRDSSILVQGDENVYFSAKLAEYFWRNKPIILESEHYGPSKKQGHWGDGSKYFQAVEDYHASYVSIHHWPREFLQENKELIERINLQLGYRILPVEIKWQKNVRISEAVWKISYCWINKGVAPCYQDLYPIITWKDEKGGIVAVFTDTNFNLRQLYGGNPENPEVIKKENKFYLPIFMKEGNYSVYISAGSITGTPLIKMPLQNEDGNNQYLIGKVHVYI